jgi:hypothetical protein
VNTRNRFCREILHCKNLQVRLASIEIVGIRHETAFVFAGAGRHGGKHGFSRCAVLEMVLLDGAAFQIVFEQDIARRVAHPGGPGDNVILELLDSRGRTMNELKDSGGRRSNAALLKVSQGRDIAPFGWISC